MYELSGIFYGILSVFSSLHSKNDDVGYYLYKGSEMFLKIPNNIEFHNFAVDYLKLGALNYKHNYSMYCLAKYYETNKDYEKAEFYYLLYCKETQNTPEYPQVALRYASMLITLSRNMDSLKLLQCVIDYYEQGKKINIIDEEFNEQLYITDAFHLYGSILIYHLNDNKGLKYLQTGYNIYGNQNCKKMIGLYCIKHNLDLKQELSYICDDCDSSGGDKKRQRVYKT
jgi:hypothetical protein